MIQKIVDRIIHQEETMMERDVAEDLCTRELNECVDCMECDDQFEKFIDRHRKEVREMSKVIDVVAHTNGKVIWVNSDVRNEVRICSLDKLKGMKPIKALLSEQEGSVDNVESD